mgnify:FL=1
MNEELLELPEEFNDDKCIDYILNLIPAEDKANITRDDVQFILDAIYDFYEENGLIDEEVAKDSYIDETEELNYVRKACKEEGIKLSDEQIQLILDGEYQYGIEIGIYEEDE